MRSCEFLAELVAPGIPASRCESESSLHLHTMHGHYRRSTQSYREGSCGAQLRSNGDIAQRRMRHYRTPAAHNPIGARVNDLFNVDKHLFSATVLCSLHLRTPVNSFGKIAAKRFRFHPQSNHSLPAQFDSNIRARARCLSGAIAPRVSRSCHGVIADVALRITISIGYQGLVSLPDLVSLGGTRRQAEKQTLFHAESPSIRRRKREWHGPT